MPRHDGPEFAGSGCRQADFLSNPQFCWIGNIVPLCKISMAETICPGDGRQRISCLDDMRICIGAATRRTLCPGSGCIGLLFWLGFCHLLPGRASGCGIAGWRDRCWRCNIRSRGGGHRRRRRFRLCHRAFSRSNRRCLIRRSCAAFFRIVTAGNQKGKEQERQQAFFHGAELRDDGLAKSLPAGGKGKMQSQTVG